MRRRLFLTGPMGCGKSTAIARALGEAAALGGGFFTRRRAFSQGHAVSFCLDAPDGSRSEVFLDFSQGSPRQDRTVFSGLGVSLLEDTGKPFVILDEIGGLELLCPEFAAALDRVFARQVPCVGVLKAPGAARSLAKALGLEDAYTQAAQALTRRLTEDPDTLVYPCGQFDEHALELCLRWRQEYVNG